MALSRSFTDSASSGTDASSYTFAGESFGAADSARYVLVGIGSRAGSARTISSVTIGGVSASILMDHSSSGSLAGFAIAAVPTGATGDVEVVFSGTMVRCFIGIWRILDLGSTTPTDTGTDGAVASLTTNLDISADGAAFAVGFRASAGTPTWTNLTADTTIALESNTASFASDEFASAQTALAITCAFAGNSTNVFAAISLAPAAGGSATDLTIQDATHGHTADSLTLTTSTVLTIAEATHGHTADNLTLSVSGATDLTIQDATHGQTADNLTLTVTGSVDLIISDALHAHLADNITLGGLYTDLELILKILSNRQELNAGTGTFTIYDDDSVSVLFTANAWADAAGTVPYTGGTLGRIDALA